MSGAQSQQDRFESFKCFVDPHDEDSKAHVFHGKDIYFFRVIDTVSIPNISQSTDTKKITEMHF